jgi:EAL domain-containing protein (putative c-di-GMP-specific phosphodiesterase class I)
MSIIAEGVETADQLAFLATEGCDGVQGYLLGKPLPIVQYSSLIGGARALDLVLKTA